MSDDTLFPLSPLITSKGSSTRGDAWRRRAAQRLAAMHAAHGKGPEGTTCKGCTHLVRYNMGRSWLKCHKARVSQSDATDWRAGWPACGLYQPTEKEV